MQTAIVVYNVEQAEYLQTLTPSVLLAPGQAPPPTVSRVVLTRGCRALEPIYASGYHLVAFEDSVAAVVAARGKRADCDTDVSAYAYSEGSRHNFTTRFSTAKEYRQGMCTAIDEKQRWLAFALPGLDCVCFDPRDCPPLVRSLLS